ncbi:hypothetical protein Pmani_023758 [Petrolisthes manimaculis]|uniref:Uncharacterized protein n=1 Tax=Petrolisthes manimaculis TaxID=1843537 RepID=A0AAE1PBL5_9EUCA|nr:hypothetical protein Pmani_023758 [Petrolisthes manimaculis]
MYSTLHHNTKIFTQNAYTLTLPNFSSPYSIPTLLCLSSYFTLPLPCPTSSPCFTFNQQYAITLLHTLLHTLPHPASHPLPCLSHTLALTPPHTLACSLTFTLPHLSTTPSPCITHTLQPQPYLFIQCCYL